MSQNNYLFERSDKDSFKQSGFALHWICMVLLALTISACGGGGGGGSDAPATAATPMDPVDPIDPIPPGIDPVDPMPDPMDPDPGNEPPAPSDQAIFEATVYPIITRQSADPAFLDCVDCHNGNLPVIRFADANPANAYATVTSQGLVTLNNPDMSRLHLRPLPPPAGDGHNCGNQCAAIAADYLAAITDWANQVGAGGGGNQPPPSNVVASATTNFSQVVEGSVPRADANMITYFDFSEGTGNTTVGTSNVGASITLNLTGTEWDPAGGLRNVDGKAQASLADSQKLFALLANANQFSVEAWVIPENTTQTGPARIVSYSIDTGRRNFTMGQRVAEYISRVQTLETGPNGSNPELRAAEPAVTTDLTHVVMTYDNMSGGRKIYVNGLLAAEETIQGDMLNWQDDNIFVLGNEVTNNRLWRGVFKMVAIHNRALNGAEIAQNFEAGEGAVTSLRFDVASVLGVPGYVEMQAFELDPAAYVFARPMLVTDATGVQVKNIRVAVNNVVPVATQAFRRVNMTVMQSGQEISPLGAVIPSDMGMALDQFHLEFEILGAQTGTTEVIGGPTPPTPPADVPEPEHGVRTFSQVHDAMAAITGVSQGDRDVRDRYNDLRDQLPPNSDVLGFGAAQQIAIQRLATTYCGEITNNNNRCRNFFNDNNCAIGAGEKDAIAGAVYEKIVGANLVNQPDQALTIAELVAVINDPVMNCVNGCTGATGRQALQAVRTSALASSAVTIN